MNHQTDTKQLKNNFLHTFTLFLKQLHVPVTKSSALEYLETHPDEGSMLAYSDALNYFKIENAAVRITPQDLISLPTPFIAFSQINGGTFSVVKNLSDSSIEWFDTQKGWVNSKLEEFTNTWSGVVLLAETDEQSGEKNYTHKRRQEILSNIRIPIAIGLLVLVFLFFVLQAPVASLAVYALLALKAAGMVISTLLFIKSIDNANSLVNKLCNAGSKISCQSILDSPAAKITPWFSWSDAGFIYFFGSFLGLLLSLYQQSYLNTYLTVQLIFSGFALIFSTYSLYYQGMKAKMWCTFCIAVVFIFILENLTLYLIFQTKWQVEGNYFINQIIIGITIPIVFLLIFKNLYYQSYNSIYTKKELTKIFSQEKLINSYLNNSEILKLDTDQDFFIQFGNLNARHQITLILNPFCHPCKYEFITSKDLVSKNNNFRLTIVLISKNNDEIGQSFIKNLYSIPASLRFTALDQFFLSGNYLKTFKMIKCAENESFNELKYQLLKKQIFDNGVYYTPSMYLNLRKLPKSFNLNNLKFLK